MRVTQSVTRAERAFVVDEGLTVLGMVNITPEKIEAAYLRCIKQAIDDARPMITDNYTMMIDPKRAPVTNQSFPRLRAVVIIPLPGQGAVCLDQTVSGGIIAKEKVDRLMALGLSMIQTGQLELDEDTMLAHYEAAT
jgi:hypothetical protein